MNPITVVHSRPIWLQQTETWIFNQVRHLDNNINAHVLCKKVVNADQFPVERLHRYGPATVLQRCREKFCREVRGQHMNVPLYLALKKISPDILHSHFGRGGFLDMAAARKAGVKHVVTFYGYDVNRLPRDPVWRQRYKQLFRHIDMVLCEGHFMANAVGSLGCPRSKIQVHHLGVAVDAIAFRPRVHKPGQPFRVFMASSFRQKKGIPTALQALSRLRHHYPLEITILGDASAERSSQAEKKIILETIQANDLASITRLLGYQPHHVFLNEAYNHHVFLSPSVTAADGDTEGGAPVSIIEMAAGGIPVVSTLHCDIPGIIQDGRSGLLASEHDVEGLQEKLAWLFDHPEKWAELATQARQHVQREFDAATQGHKLSALYRKVLD